MWSWKEVHDGLDVPHGPLPTSTTVAWTHVLGLDRQVDVVAHVRRSDARLRPHVARVTTTSQRRGHARSHRFDGWPKGRLIGRFVRRPLSTCRMDWKVVRD